MEKKWVKKGASHRLLPAANHGHLIFGESFPVIYEVNEIDPVQYRLRPAIRAPLKIVSRELYENV